MELNQLHSICTYTEYLAWNSISCRLSTDIRAISISVLKSVQKVYVQIEYRRYTEYLAWNSICTSCMPRMSVLSLLALLVRLYLCLLVSKHKYKRTSNASKLSTSAPAACRACR
jgi:hypothetical protein